MTRTSENIFDIYVAHEKAFKNNINEQNLDSSWINACKTCVGPIDAYPWN